MLSLNAETLGHPEKMATLACENGRVHLHLPERPFLKQYRSEQEGEWTPKQHWSC